MRYSRVFLSAIGVELPPVVVTSAELEARLAPLYRKLHFSEGQLESLTGIRERRWWEPGDSLARGAIAAAHKALAAAGVAGREIEVLIYGGVCRELLEPAAACEVADAVGVSPAAAIHDLSNACLGIANGILDIANRIELGQVSAGLVVSAESAREINDVAIERLNADPTMELFVPTLATLTGGSGAAAVLVTDGSVGNGRFNGGRLPRLAGGVHRCAPQHHGLCRWWVSEEASGDPGLLRQFMATDSVGVLKNGVALGIDTWNHFLEELGWSAAEIDRIVCHQVGSEHQQVILRSIGMPAERDFPTYPFLGNIGTVSLPMTAALAAERGFLEPGQRVGFLGIGSGLVCLMLGWEW